MGKIKGQGRFTKAVTTKVAAFNKNRFIRCVCEGTILKKLSYDLQSNHSIDADIVSFSSAHDFGEQILSVLSFIRYVGVPSSWTLYSDGTHTNGQIKQLDAFTFLKFIKIDFNGNYVHDNIKTSLLSYRDALISYGRDFPLGKKLFLYLNFTIVRPTVFLDSDVLFYQKAVCLNNVINDNNNGWFLPDVEWGSLDSRYTASTTPQHYQVNSGFLVLNKEIPKLSRGLEFLVSLNGKYEYFSEQTVMHILLLENNFMPLDPRIFTLNSGDQFDFHYLYSRETIAIRHYTGPVRHKMWQRNWKWHLSLA